MKRVWTSVACVVALWLTGSLAGCARMADIEVVPATLSEQAQIPGMSDVRVWGDSATPLLATLLRREAATLRAKYAARTPLDRDPEANILAISGGADDGAFAAALLVGWGERGDRPAFDVVTGVSAGALVAPFAFLGTAYDRQLASLFTEHSDAEIYRANPVAGVLGGPSVADNAPLATLIARYVDRRMLTRIAAERAKGRVLLIGTTNLNAERPVYWDMGRIAQIGNDPALQLFRNILLASAAIPGIFPPVPITVTAKGRTFQEIHVDGGPTREIFLAPAGFSFKQIDALVGRPIKRRLWVIKNGKLAPEYETVNLTAASIAVRALGTLTKNQGIGDLHRIYQRARADDMEFNLASIPLAFNEPRTGPFAKSYMTALYQAGLKLGRDGYRWARTPPDAGPTTSR